MTDEEHIAQLQKELKAAKRFPINTSPASRHLEMMADAFARGDGYVMFEEEPKHCAITIYAVLVGYYTAKSIAITSGKD